MYLFLANLYDDTATAATTTSVTCVFLGLVVVVCLWQQAKKRKGRVILTTVIILARWGADETAESLRCKFRERFTCSLELFPVFCLSFSSRQWKKR